MDIKRFRYLQFKKITTKSELAKLLEIDARFLTRTLYIPPNKNNYHHFTIAKRSGGERIIHAPNDELKDIQRRLSDLLFDCKQVILEKNEQANCLSHGFERKKSIITNAEIHKGKKNVLNIDLQDFFGHFNFGRVRGYFIANREFELDANIATVVAKIACHDNMLPQGSPCSPVIANLITNSLDIRLSRLAHKAGCSYTRYADDITFSTNKSRFPKSIVADEVDLVLGAKVVGEIRRFGLTLNNKKTRLLLSNSRQEATGLIINKKVNVKSDYWRVVRSMAFNQFKKGCFFISDGKGASRAGKLNELEGRLTFIDSIDHYNNILKKNFPRSCFENKKFGMWDYRYKLNSREDIYSRFLYYKLFYKSKFPTILTEGKTDNVYLKAALSNLRHQFPSLVNVGGLDKYSPKLNFPNLNDKTRYFLELDGGATNYIKFVKRYAVEHEYFENQTPSSPVILVLDNDSGPAAVLKEIVSIKSDPGLTVEILRKKAYAHVIYNLYVILTPLRGRDKNQSSSMEDLFYKKTLNIKLDKKVFNRSNNVDRSKEYGKHIFSTKVVRENKEKINFSKFKSVFKKIEKAKEDFKKKNKN